MSELSRRDLGRLMTAGLLAPTRVQGQSSKVYRYVHVDVFTDRAYEGNQLYVFPEPQGLDADRMHTLSRESNLSECTFVFPPEQPGTEHRVRIFTRNGETPFAGHPTLGTAFVLANTGVIKAGTARTVFGLGAGPTPIDLEWQGSRLAFAWMTQLKPTFGKTITDAAALAAAIGVDASAVAGQKAPAQEVNCGSTFVVVPLATRKAVDAAVLDRAKTDAVFAAAGIQRRGLYVFSTERGTDDATAYSRMLGAGGIEDPATGSAAGPAGAFMAQHGFVPPDRADGIVILQGVLVRRPSRLHVKIGLTGGAATTVKVGGRAVMVGEGTMTA
jgi:trans-2,3-dihydro-3-hydroxyanthranilate isomerase